jgi:carbamoyl-phosphate synthase large subunit
MGLNILISSAGRRVGLMRCLRESTSELGLEGKIVAIDAAVTSAAGQLADAFYVVPNCMEPTFVPEVHLICNSEHIGLLIPTIDRELPIYASTTNYLRALGTEVAISSEETIAICGNKVLTHEWLTENGFPVPRQTTPECVLANRSEWPLPLVLKPIQGSASHRVRIVTSFAELETLTSNNDDLLVQEFVHGDEYTVNVFVDGQGQCLCAVPHRRLEVRSGEVSKGVTVRHHKLIGLARAIAERLPGAYGALNLQCFVGSDDSMTIIEINARFGGGYPLTHKAGAPITRWLLQETLGMRVRGPFDKWEAGIVMLRYDDAVFLAEGLLTSSRSYAESVRGVRS